MNLSGIFCFGVVNLAITITSVNTVETSSFSDYKSLHVPLRMSAVGATVSESSVISCGLRCLNSVQECNSFVYNTSLSLCTPGSLLSPFEAFNSTIGKQYFKQGTYCNRSLANFTLRSIVSVSTCMFISNASTNYITAKNTCKDLGATLYILKVREKLDLLLNIVKDDPIPYWVGLDDIQQESIFRWADDNSILNVNYTIFGAGQPNNAGNQDCVNYAPDIKLLNDWSCDASMRYICELAPLVI
ncbi:uncharacterized protein LOC106074353 [Biomphalaria glabrata]|uniref:Uncharacterized protein LOC106074353 n=1 Tax=Biomphalaria glabrata TaxID=6526 RepID=A0A9W2YEC7_BIOGL|nr:uncharacterized protein LOC106074353 [Biomphalaria glabrata]XP_055861036.1 uncharacterized protein LOC106074353 [Biomphalaria glabrata]XP_055861037.1 uncharacterized protein LOC106074353 [Biomphalaria glabrata]XP_055861038.1 uncharacterized protein LOC106074353 [Biomphalaria glabrata]XP_055861039.1 uncharacterized protein LOC106074353 [Biomphalaria glabrata]